MDDEDYDLDDFDTDELDDYDSGGDDGTLDDYAIEEAGSLDGEQESNLGMAGYSCYGSSINLDDLTDEQRDLYDNAYHASRDN